jgi:hypothetical protein
MHYHWFTNRRNLIRQASHRAFERLARPRDAHRRSRIHDEILFTLPLPVIFASSRRRVGDCGRLADFDENGQRARVDTF